MEYSTDYKNSTDYKAGYHDGYRDGIEKCISILMAIGYSMPEIGRILASTPDNRRVKE